MDERRTRMVMSLVGSKESFDKLAARVVTVVKDSFTDDHGIQQLIVVPVTPHEVRRRVDLCYDWFMKLCGDLSYSTNKALDFLPRCLRSSLDGDGWEPPPAERSWAPEKVMGDVN